MFYLFFGLRFALLSCVATHNSYLLMFVYIRRSVSVVFCPSSPPPALGVFKTLFQFPWHCMLLTYVYFVPNLAVASPHHTAYEQHELCVTRQDSRRTHAHA